MSRWAIGIQYIFGSIGTHLNDDCDQKLWDQKGWYKRQSISISPFGTQGVSRSIENHQ